MLAANTAHMSESTRRLHRELIKVLTKSEKLEFEIFVRVYLFKPVYL